MKILFVDDVAENLKALQEPLAKGLQCELEILQHGWQSAAQLAQEILLMKPDWILMDGNLANDVKGYEVTRPLAAAGLKVIGFSTVSWLDEKFLQAGAVGFVVKDFGDVVGVVQKIKNLTERHSE